MVKIWRVNNSSNILSLSRVSIGYGNVALMDKLELDLMAGEFCLLLGANGKGKSTLLKTISGYVPALHGEISVCGERVKNLGISELAKMVSFIPSTNFIPQNVTVKDLLEFARIPYLSSIGRINKKDKERIDQIVAQLGIGNWLTKSYMTLSDGQKQIVNIARSLVQETKLILLDEPTAHLDLENKSLVFKLLRSLTDEGKTIMCSTHDVYQGFEFATKFFVIDAKTEVQIWNKEECRSVNDLTVSMFG